jgi:general L-amino acid transport system permease protein
MTPAPAPPPPGAARPPPLRAGGLARWARRNLFAGLLPTVATLAVAALALRVLPGLWRWLVGDAVFRADYAPCRALEYRAACWGFVAEKWRLILFGRYPFAEQWRAGLATAGLLALLSASAFPWVWRLGLGRLLALWAAGLAAFLLLLAGGVLGLARVEPGLWGGLPLTLLLTVVGMGASMPLGVVLALARRSELPLARAVASVYIELVRGVPLITVLFTASYVLPLVLPEGLRLGTLSRIGLAITLFQAAYLAEVVRGGLAAVPRGQREAAASLGLSAWQTQRKVVLPQALVVVIPSFVNSLLSTFMDTSLVTVVSMYDLTGALRLALGDPQWRNFFIEGYLFVGALYFAGCLAMSRYSQWLERRLGSWMRRAEATR